MKRLILAFIAGWFTTFAITLHAQPVGLTHAIVREHSGVVGTTDLTGYVTYRVYAEFKNEADFLVALHGNTRNEAAPFEFSPDDEDIAIHANCDCYNSPYGDLLGNRISKRAMEAQPEAAFDTYYTINLTHSEQKGSLSASTTVTSTGTVLPANPCNWILDDGSIYTLPDQPNGLAGETRRVLIAQITTCSTELSIEVCLQTFIEGARDNMHFWCTETPYVIR